MELAGHCQIEMRRTVEGVNHWIGGVRRGARGALVLLLSLESQEDQDLRREI